MSLRPILKITVVGNIAGGKSRLSRRLSKIHNLPLTHVDSLQFLPGMKIRPQDETRQALLAVTRQERWIIDGYGPLDLIEKRFQAADKVIFVDFPIWRHYWWLSKRQVTNLWNPREELPEGCHEISWGHTVKLYKTLWQIHSKMRPELLRIFARDDLKDKVLFVRTLKEWESVFKNGVL